MPAGTAIIMSDNRPPIMEQMAVRASTGESGGTSSSSSAITLSYPALAFALNAVYACRHGYDVLYYQMGSHQCSHTLQGVRIFPRLFFNQQKHAALLACTLDEYLNRLWAFDCDTTCCPKSHT
eukprot:2009109-Pleurochrysis_carterae.AAC.2